MDCVTWAPLSHGFSLCSASGRLQHETEGWGWRLGYSLLPFLSGSPSPMAIALTSTSLEGIGMLKSCPSRLHYTMLVPLHLPTPL